MLIERIKDVAHVEDKVFKAIKDSSAPVVLFGAGDMACYILSYLRQHGLEPAGICDNDSTKQGTEYLGLPVFSYDALKGKFGGRYNVVVSVGLESKDAVYAQLVATGEKNPVWYLRGYELCGEKLNYRYIHENLSLFEDAYASFADEFSREVFINVLNAKISGDFDLYKTIKSANGYFDENLIKLTDNEAFLDVGAYKGDAIFAFAQRTKQKYDLIIGLEPDKKTFHLLQVAVKKEKIQKVELYNKGVWHSSGFLSFDGGRGGSSRFLENLGVISSNNYAEVDAIDNILRGRRITYISVDVEGAEHNAILGAEKTIKKWKPKMAVCVYHKRQDIFDILLLLKSFVPEYKFYLRHYTDNQTETVLYAI